MRQAVRRLHLGGALRSSSARDPGEAVSVLRERIQQRLAAKRAEYANFRGYQEYRIKEEDLHGAWDVAINMSEVSCYCDALLWVLEQLPDGE